MKSNKGFTLIELLVVIAIIGILSSVVLASLNTARTKAKNAGATSQLRSLAPAFLLCIDGGGLIVAPTAAGDATTAAAGGGNVCNPTTATNTTWPSLVPFGAFYTVLAGNEAAYSAKVTSGTTVLLTCDQTGCK